MKTPCLASHALSFLVLTLGLASASPLSAQVYSVPPPPPGYGTTPARQPASRATRQSAAAIQTPVTHPQYPGTYPPPPGYTYPPPPPGYGTTPKSSAKKPAQITATSSKKTVTKKPQAGPPPPLKAASPSGDLNRQVVKIRENDKAQNQRIGALERDVSNIQRGSTGDAPVRHIPYNGGSDLAAHTTYISRPGDTLWRIAAMHRVSVGEIQQLNRMTEDEVRVGQTLLIPSPRSISAPPPSYTQVSYNPTVAPRESSPPTTMVKVSAPVYYTVKKGDSLKGIALKHKMAPTTLASANKIKDPNKIVVGQRLKIPGRTTTVTVASKAKPAPRRESSDTVPLPGYGMPPPPSSGLSQPPPAASLAPAPAPMAPAPAPAPRAPDTSDSHRGILAYRVDRTDTIETIATQFTTTPDQIRDMNRLSPGSTLKAGDEIMVPAMGAVSVSSR